MESGKVVSEATTEVKNEIRNEEEKLLVVAPDGEVKEIAVLTEIKKKRNQIQVSNVKKPFFYYYNLSKRYIKQYNEVELSALGMAIPTVVTIAEILKKNGLAFQKYLTISSVSLKNGENDRLVMKPKIEIALINAEKMKNISTATTKFLKEIGDLVANRRVNGRAFGRSRFNPNRTKGEESIVKDWM